MVVVGGLGGNGGHAALGGAKESDGQGIVNARREVRCPLSRHLAVELRDPRAAVAPERYPDGRADALVKERALVAVAARYVAAGVMAAGGEDFLQGHWFAPSARPVSVVSVTGGLPGLRGGSTSPSSSVQTTIGGRSGCSFRSRSSASCQSWRCLLGSRPRKPIVQSRSTAAVAMAR